MAALDLSAAAAALKVYYSTQRVVQLTYKDAPLYAMIPKHKDFFGKSMPLPMRVTNPQGRSATFATAQANKTPSKYRDFVLTRNHDYSLASIDSETIMASESNAGAFLKLAIAEIDGAIESLRRSVQIDLFGDGSGARAQVGSVSQANNTITLSNVEDVVRFEAGQQIVVWSAKTGGSQRIYETGVTVAGISGVDRDLGILTMDEDITANVTIVANDWLFVEGDRGNKFKGLQGWIPDTAPAPSDSWFGVDRSLDATRLAGVRVTSSNKPIDEALIDAARRLGREGHSPDVAVLSFTKYASLEKTLGTKIRYTDVSVAGFSFRAIELPGPSGTIKVFADKDCDEDHGYMLTLDTWGLYSLKDTIQVLDLDGNRMLREATADAYEVRVATFLQLGCDNPGANAVLLF